MSKLSAHKTMDDNDNNRVLARIHPASEKSVALVLDADPLSNDGRSNWCWVRLPNGDLVLGVFPQGDTYCAVEDDAQYRE